VHAIEEGRTLYSNLRKGVSYYLACKLALISTMTLSTILQLPVPYLPIQIVVMEAFMDVVGSSTFTAEPAEYDVMSRPPRDPSLQFLDRRLIGKIVICGAGLFAATTSVYIWSCTMNGDHGNARTMAFTSWMVGYLALAWVMRSNDTPLHVLGFGTNKLLPVWTILTIVTLIVTLTIPTLREILRLEGLSPGQWAIAVLVPSLAAFCLEVSKIYRYMRRATAVDRC
jgi:P-type Ca2+ transporter type 2C